MRPVFWNTYIDDLFRNLPVITAYADDCTLSHFYLRQDSQGIVAEVNQQLHLNDEWGKHWHVPFATEKTQTMVVSRSLEAAQAVEGRGIFGTVTPPLQDYVRITGVDMDRELCYDHHLKHVAQQSSLKVSALRRVAILSDKRRVGLLYKAQGRPYLEYGALT